MTFKQRVIVCVLFLLWLSTLPLWKSHTVQKANVDRNTMNKALHGSSANRVDVDRNLTYFYRQIVHDLAPWNEKGITLSALLQGEQRISKADVVLIWNRTVYHKGTSIHLKAPLWRESIQDMLTTGKIDPPNVAFVIHFHATPQDKKDNPAGPPILGMAHDSSTMDVLYPNPFFDDYFTIIRQTQLVPWEQKIAIAFWRGQCNKKKGSMPRIQLLQMKSPLLNASFTKSCIIDTWPEEEHQAILSLSRTRKVSLDEMSRYKYLIVMPGATSGSYSKSMQYFGSLGSVVLAWENDAMEFYYHRLQEGVHFLYVNATTLLPTVEYLRQHDDYAHSLAKSLSSFVNNYLTEVQLVRYYQNLFDCYSRLQRFDPTPDILSHVGDQEVPAPSLG